MYQRKTEDEYELYGMYEGNWEYLLTESTRSEAREREKEYRDNEGINTKIVRRRVRKEQKCDTL